MKKLNIFATATAIAAISVTIAASAHKTPFEPGARTLMLAHNAYPDKDSKYSNRLDQALSGGVPFAVEEDLVWVNGKSLLIHNEREAGPESPTIESYFFPKVAPLMEKALKDGNKGNWPLITLYFDIKNDPVEHLEVISKTLDKYDAWLTKALKTNDITKMSPLELKPMIVILEDKQNDIKKEFFYDRVPVGGKIRAFGSAVKFDDNPTHLPRTARDERFANMLKFQPDQLLKNRADNWRRWVGTDWRFIESCGPEHGKDWSATTAARIKQFVDYGHSMGYLVSFYHINGFSAAENQGWTDEYNFGSKEAAILRWKAALDAHADFIATDQYEDVAKFLHGKR
ncbi:MAG: hypothetical protein J2P21_09460 [Chloracidobacterium sp.]|nr:hypothetical protein [Chloracidobacterium sp.]